VKCDVSQTRQSTEVVFKLDVIIFRRRWSFAFQERERGGGGGPAGGDVPAWPDPPPPGRPRTRRRAASVRSRRRAEPRAHGGPQAQAAVDRRPPRALCRRRHPARRARE
jgi:hypothetical protein